jgi:hypothetical protein
MASRDVMWCRTLLEETGFKQQTATTIYEDNNPCIQVAETRKHLPGVKHIEVRYHFIRERIARNEITLKRKRTDEMIADIFTKNLSPSTFNKFRDQLRIGSSHSGEVLE